LFVSISLTGVPAVDHDVEIGAHLKDERIHLRRNAKVVACVIEVSRHTIAPVPNLSNRSSVNSTANHSIVQKRWHTFVFVEIFVKKTFSLCFVSLVTV
jgi:hypothetical protein